MTKFVVIAGLMCMLGGCTLMFDVDAYPYANTAPMDMGHDQFDLPSPDLPDAVDMPDIPEEDQPPDLPTSPVSLAITEIMINTLPMGMNGELGEYIEVKNVGETPADPRHISFFLFANQGRTATISVPSPVTQEELDIYNQLKDIPPGGYFVFVRFEVPELPLASICGAGNYFDYGEYGSAASLGNSGARRAELQYFSNGEFVHMDAVRWVNGSLRPSDPELDMPLLNIVEDSSLGVRPGFEDATQNDDPQNWCVESAFVAGPETFIGSPCRIAVCQ